MESTVNTRDTSRNYIMPRAFFKYKRCTITEVFVFKTEPNIFLVINSLKIVLFMNQKTREKYATTT